MGADVRFLGASCVAPGPDAVSRQGCRLWDDRSIRCICCLVKTVLMTLAPMDQVSWLMETSPKLGDLRPLSTGRGGLRKDTGIRGSAMSWSWMGCLLECAPRRCVNRESA